MATVLRLGICANVLQRYLEGDFNREVTDSQAKNIVEYAWVKIKFPCEIIVTSGRVGGMAKGYIA